MFDYGYQSSISALTESFFSHQRRTGRTTNLINIVNSGDLVIFKTWREAERVKRQAEIKGKDIKTATLAPYEPLSTIFEFIIVLNNVLNRFLSLLTVSNSGLRVDPA